MSNRSVQTTFITIRSSRLRVLLPLGLALALLAVASSPAAAAPPKLSWNLSRDLLTNMSTIQAPPSPWTLGEWSSLVPNGALNTSAFIPFKFTAPTNCAGSSWSWLSCWFTTSFAGNSGLALIGISTATLAPHTHGVPLLHPGYFPGPVPHTKYAVVKWTNPQSQPLNIEILGRISDIDPNCGDGIKYGVLQGTSPAAIPLINNFNSSPLNNISLSSTSDTFHASTVVTPSDTLYFVVDANNDFFCDSTQLDILIVSK